MQSAESVGLEPGGFTNPQDSIKQGVSYFAECVRKAQENNCDIKCAVQSYNFGSGFIDYAAHTAAHICLNFRKVLHRKNQTELKRIMQMTLQLIITAASDTHTEICFMQSL